MCVANLIPLQSYVVLLPFYTIKMYKVNVIDEMYLVTFSLIFGWHAIYIVSISDSVSEYLYMFISYSNISAGRKIMEIKCGGCILSTVLCCCVFVFNIFAQLKMHYH
jgi:hypothetical protein